MELGADEQYVYTSFAPFSPPLLPPFASPSRSRASTRPSTRASSFSECSFRSGRQSSMSLASSVPSSDTWSPSEAECGCCPSTSSLSTASSALTATPSTPSSSRAWSGKAREGLFTSPEAGTVYGKCDGSLIRIYAARACSWVNGDIEEVGEWFSSFMLSLGMPVYPSDGRFRLSPTGPKLAWMRGSLDIFRPVDDARCAHCKAQKVRNWRGTAVAYPCIVEAEFADGPAPASSCVGCKAAGVPCDLYQGACVPVQEKQRLEVRNLPELLAVARDAVAALEALSRAAKQSNCQQAAVQDVARDVAWIADQLERAKRPDADSKL